MLAEIPDPIPPDSRRSSNRHEPKRFVFQWLAILATRWKQLPPPTNNTDEQHRRTTPTNNTDERHLRPTNLLPRYRSVSKPHACGCRAPPIQPRRPQKCQLVPATGFQSPACDAYILRRTVFPAQPSTSNATGNAVIEGRCGRIQPMLHEASSSIHPYKTRLRATQNHNSTSKLQIKMHVPVLCELQVVVHQVKFLG